VSEIFSTDAGLLVAMTMLIMAACLTGFGFGFAARGKLEDRRQKRINAALQGSLKEISGPALYARTKGEPFTNVLRRHERDARRDRV
jgi:hypothetical protein